MQRGLEDPWPARALLVDLYELTMAQAYYAGGIHEREATFSLFTRHLPEGWGYLLAAGLDDVLAFLEAFAFEEEDLAYLETTQLFTADFLDKLRGVRFTGEVRALPEGTLFFPDEPVLEVTAPVVEAQLVETSVLNQIHFQSLVAGKAARCVDVARGRTLVDFSLRRTHGTDAGLKVARSSYLAGFDSTSNVLAGARYGIPIAGTMAHSFVECFDDELEAFRAFARAYPENAVLIVDTYDTVKGVRRASVVAGELASRRIRLRGVRLDSGDLLELAREARSILDAAGFADATVFASGGIDEHEIESLLRSEAPISGFGVGSRLGTSADAPYLDMAYKLASFDGKPRLKLSAKKATWPGRKQVWRCPKGGTLAFDVLGLDDEEGPEDGEPLLEVVMTQGRRAQDEPLNVGRARAAEQRARLPLEHRGLSAAPYEVRMTPALIELQGTLASEIRRRHGIR